MIDLSEIRLEQAKTLKADATRSALSVGGIVLYITVLLLASRRYGLALIWFISAMTMIGITVLYARFVAADGISFKNYRAYLRGHIAVTVCTGLVWGSVSLLVVDYDSYFSIFIAVTIATSITIGGMFPGNSYRPAYIALTIPTILPLSTYIILTAPLPIRYFGIGLAPFFAFTLITGARAELATRDWIISRTQKKLADSVVAHSAEVKRAYDSKTQFLSAASHDLSQPLHAQGHYIEALRKTARSDNQRELIEKLAATWRTQKEMLGDLVDVMRLDGGILQPRFETVDLSEVLHGVISQFALEAKQKNVRIIADLPDRLDCLSDPVFLRRLISNALSNALRHAAYGGDIDLEIDQFTDVITIRIKDRGPGFDVKGNVFDAPQELRRGGMGLTSIENMSKLLNAEPSLMNREDGNGAIFSLKLPIEMSSQPDQGMGEVFSASSVLIIDDERSILDAVTVLFTQWGVQTLSATSVEDALSILDATQMPIDLLIVDNRLSEIMDAPQAISTIRSVTRDNLPAVVVSGDVYAPSKLAELDGVTILPKPVEARSFQAYFRS